MPCFKPLTAWIGDRNSNGKFPLVFKRPGGFAVQQGCPCGQCFGCRLDYSYDWATRCVCEAQMHEKNCLILLTYQDLPAGGSLQLADWQNFMKLLRAEVGPVRHFHAGEYGSKNGRPHDHALLFGHDFSDKVFLKMSAAGFPLYTSAKLSKLWKKGHCTVGQMSFESAGYLARYLMEKPTLTKAVRDENGVVVGRTYTDQAIKKYGESLLESTGELVLSRRPEYLTMSRRPGIGESWLRKYWKDVYPHDFMVLRSGAKMPPPRYFDTKVAEWNLVDMEQIKLYRVKRAKKKEEVWNDVLQKMQVLDVNREDRLKIMEECKEAMVNLYRKERGAML